MRILIISADGFEDSELLMPRDSCIDAGMQVDIASFASGPIRGKHGCEVEAGIAVNEVRPEDYDALILPGGTAPQKLRRSAEVLAVVRAFFESGKPIAAICHGPQILISACLLSDRSATCYRTVARELAAAGAHYKDCEVVVDGNLVTSRGPSDLPAFLRETMRKLRAREAQTVASRDRR